MEIRYEGYRQLAIIWKKGGNLLFCNESHGKSSGMMTQRCKTLAGRHRTE